MGNDGTNHAGEEARNQRDLQLNHLGIRILGQNEEMRVKQLDDLLEEVELGHGVGDLTTPQRGEAPEREARFSPVTPHGGGGRQERSGEAASWRSLHLHLRHLAGTQREVSDEFRGSRRPQPNDAAVSRERLFADHVRVEVFEKFVETEPAEALHRVPEEGRCPAQG